MTLVIARVDLLQQAITSPTGRRREALHGPPSICRCHRHRHQGLLRQNTQVRSGRESSRVARTATVSYLQLGMCAHGPQPCSTTCWKSRDICVSAHIKPSGRCLEKLPPVPCETTPAPHCSPGPCLPEPAWL